METIKNLIKKEIDTMISAIEKAIDQEVSDKKYFALTGELEGLKKARNIIESHNPTSND